MLIKCGITHNMSYFNSLGIVIHSPCETSFYTAAFACTLVYEREATIFLTKDNLSDILNAICTE